MSENSTELAPLDAAPASIVDQFRNNSLAVYTTLEDSDFASRKAVLAAMGTDKNVADNVGKTLTLENFVVHTIELPDEVTGELKPVTRSILMCKEGNYAAVSNGIASALQRFVGILGKPSTWPEPVQVVIVKDKAARGSYLSLQLA